ncbi:hypothetical protein M4951_23650 [Blastopirellula sp. J2-11]|uniref:hypothetical protein n=1 Tax=Blastopirellula sp. J2-11 TaxID=2943192 RepID=UPI0021C5874D|nr:hypothetical protein [Blastopirellula sp. J2-11]UUO06330.1 hypothetical protein M4951_23650 [Blastopirellula sp. J2-11]
MNSSLRSDGWAVLSVSIVWFCLVSISDGAAPKVESFPEFISWEEAILPEATVTGGTPPYELTYRVAETKVPIGFDFRVDPANGPLVDAMKRELGYRDIGPRRIQEFKERAGRVPNGVPLYTHIFVTGLDASGAKLGNRFTTWIEIPDDVRDELVSVIQAEQDVVRQKQEAEREKERNRLAAEKLAVEAKQLADWRPSWGAILLLFGISLVLGSLVNSLCLKATDGVESLFNRDMQWMSSGMIAQGAIGISIAAFVAAGLLGMGARQFAYYVAQARTPTEIVIWGTVAAAIGTLLAVAWILRAGCRFRGMRLIARTLCFLVANVILTFGIGLLASEIMSLV